MLILLLEHVFYQPSSAIGHLAQTIAQSLLHYFIFHILVVAVSVDIWHVQDIVSNEFFHAIDLLVVDEVFVDLVQTLDQS